MSHNLRSSVDKEVVQDSVEVPTIRRFRALPAAAIAAVGKGLGLTSSACAAATCRAAAGFRFVQHQRGHQTDSIGFKLQRRRERRERAS